MLIKTVLLTYSTQQSPSGEANQLPANLFIHSFIHSFIGYLSNPLLVMQPQDIEFVMLRNSPHFIEPEEGSLLNLQEPTIKDNLQQFIMQECRGIKSKSADWM